MEILFLLNLPVPATHGGASPALLGVAALIGIAATLEELVYRCLLFRVLERAWGTWVALAPIESRYAGPDWLTGGMFGPESSLLVIVSATVAVVVLLRVAWRNGAFLKLTA